MTQANGEERKREILERADALEGSVLAMLEQCLERVEEMLEEARAGDVKEELAVMNRATSVGRTLIHALNDVKKRVQAKEQADDEPDDEDGGVDPELLDDVRERLSGYSPGGDAGDAGGDAGETA